MIERHMKGWGYEDWIVNNELYCGKIVHFKKGMKCSLHYHKIKDETFYVLKGKGILQISNPLLNNNVTFNLKKGKEAFRILPNIRHRITAHSDLDVLEISTHHEESDSCRIEKGD